MGNCCGGGDTEANYEPMDLEESARMRAERAAAAEKRANSFKQGGGTKKQPKRQGSGGPLRGPNSQATMSWTVG